IPLLFETGYAYGLDKVAVVAAPDAVIRERALSRPGMTVQKLEAILARQLPQAEKLKRADYILDTSGQLADTRNAVAALVEALTAQERPCPARSCSTPKPPASARRWATGWSRSAASSSSTTSRRAGTSTNTSTPTAG